MAEPGPRLVGVLVGDIRREPGARIKYGLFFEALGRRFPLVQVYDATLRGLDRWLNAWVTLHPDRRIWQERFYKNLPAFRRRSQRVAARLCALRGQADVVVQVGVLLDASWPPAALPNVVYTDYTASLSARRPEAGRSPFTPAQRVQWLALERQTFERARHVCPRAEYVRQAVLADYGLPPERVTVVGGGVNFDRLPDLPERTAAAAPTALFIGKDFYRKGGDWLLAAFARARAQAPEARLVLVTDGPVPPGAPLAGVEVLAPTWDRAAIAALYRRADVFVLPSRLETWGDVLLEAMAFGLPGVGVAGQAMEEIIQPETSGLIVPAGEVELLAEALIRLFCQPAWRRQLGLAARQRVEQNFTWERVVDRLAPILAAAGGPRRPGVDL